MKYINRLSPQDFFTLTFKMLNPIWVRNHSKDTTYKLTIYSDVIGFSVITKGQFFLPLDMIFYDFDFRSIGIFNGDDLAPLPANAKQIYYDFMFNIFGEQYKKDYEKYHENTSGSENE